MKKGAIIALLVLASSVGVYADGGKNKKKAKKEKAMITDETEAIANTINVV